jgi:hypothetical protein
MGSGHRRGRGHRQINTCRKFSLQVNFFLDDDILLWCLYRPVLLATTAKLGIGQERGTRDKPSQWLNKRLSYWLDTGLLEKRKGR